MEWDETKTTTTKTTKDILIANSATATLLVPTIELEIEEEEEPETIPEDLEMEPPVDHPNDDLTSNEGNWRRQGTVIERDGRMDNDNDQMKTIDEDEEVDDDVVIHKPRKLSTAEKSELLKRMIARLRINDRVELFGGQMGTVRYLGTVETDGNENIGIELDDITIGGHNGRGKFTAREGHVYPYTLISVHVNNPNGSNEELVPVNYLDRVRLQGGRTGVVRYVGPLDGMGDATKEYIGLELDQFDPRATSGIFKGKEYFTVHPNKGAFIDKSQIVANLGSSIAMGKDLTPPNPYNGELAQGKIVKTKYYGKGKIMFIGLTGFSDGEIIGLELDHWWPNGGNGTVQEKEYFKCKPGHAYFCSRKDIERVLNETSENRGKEEKEEEEEEFQNYLSLRQMPAMRDRVQ
ncbi:hypothetical protein RFI_04721, partial [Reticulomyxa filosa]